MHIVSKISNSIYSSESLGLDPYSAYLIMSVWPIKNPRIATDAWWDVVTVLDYEQKYI
jgi:hypothetical protein